MPSTDPEWPHASNAWKERNYQYMVKYMSWKAPVDQWWGIQVEKTIGCTTAVVKQIDDQISWSLKQQGEVVKNGMATTLAEGQAIADAYLPHYL